MPEIVNLNSENEPAAQFLEPYLQSGNLNFLIGSGASAPAIKTAGNIEADINALLAANNDAEANKKSLEFITAISAVNSRLSTTWGPAPPPAIVKVRRSYINFLSSIDKILFARKNILLPRQANIFTTNYDMFLEYAASRIPGLVLNDGFDRSSVIGLPTFAPERYFDRTYRSGTFYSHQIEIPTINLIKLHGSLSWRKRSDRLVLETEPVPPLSSTDTVDPAKVDAFLKEHFLILPNLRKFHATLLERVYYDLLRLFSRAFDQQNVALFSFGFSFADEHILDLIRHIAQSGSAQYAEFILGPREARTRWLAMTISQVGTAQA
ncbi:SIR2 family protein [Bradyrhizobium sp. URHD0069]|uniref:SIR2 family protein n=1 Tax=Bradyrhizobium sp. URHD0069 TaxID=1380355 RepID=UPI00068C7817|nr:SIR2 family protein [Bradyrhizobium sp. URHD0069]